MCLCFYSIPFVKELIDTGSILIIIPQLGVMNLERGTFMRAQDCAIVLHREASFPGCVKRFVVIQTFTTWLGGTKLIWEAIYTHCTKFISTLYEGLRSIVV